MKFLKYFLFASAVFVAFTNVSLSQDSKPITVKFGGYVNWTGFYDTRQNAILREGHFLLYPYNESLDKFGNDINDKSSFNFLAIQSRLNVKVEGAEAFGANASALVEGEFFGTSDADVNGFRLRHALITLKWDNTTLSMGQTWHPMFIAEAFPQVLSFNTGSPFQPFSRNPQVKLTQSVGGVNLSVAAYAQRDFTSTGPAGGSSTYLKNSGIPGLDFGIQAKFENLIVGGNVDYKSLTPLLETSQKVKTDETISSLAGMAYLKYSSSMFTFIAEGVYGQNLTDLLMLGGYAVSSTDNATGKETYTNISTYSVWADLSYGKDVQVGVFAGYTKNLGADEIITGKYYSRGDNMDNVFRVSPRIQFTSNKFKVGAEVEYTQADYGTKDAYGKVYSAAGVANTRILISTYYLL